MIRRLVRGSLRRIVAMLEEPLPPPEPEPSPPPEPPPPTLRTVVTHNEAGEAWLSVFLLDGRCVLLDATLGPTGQLSRDERYDWAQRIARFLEEKTL